MKRRWIVMLILAVMLTNFCAGAYAQGKTVKKPVSVTLHTYSDRLGECDITGLYNNKVFYITQNEVCALTGAEMHQASASTVMFSLNNGLRKVVVANDEISETHDGKTVSLSTKTMNYQDTLYMSAWDILTYMGAVVAFGENEKAQFHLMVYMPYTVLDLYEEVRQSGIYGFSWSDADGKFIDPKKILGLAALDTVLLGFDSDISHYVGFSNDGYAKNVEQTILMTALTDMMLNDDSQSTDQTGEVFTLIEHATDHTEVATGWLEAIFDSPGSLAALKNVGKAGTHTLKGVGAVTDVSTTYLNSLYTIDQIQKIGNNRRVLLDKTLCRIGLDSRIRNMYPEMFQAAKSVQAICYDAYQSVEKISIDQGYGFIGMGKEVFADLSIARFDKVGFVKLVWDTLVGLVKLEGLNDDGLLADEKRITFASIYSDIGKLAHAMLQKDRYQMVDQHYYLGQRDTTQQEYIKYDLLLELKSSLMARQLLLETDWLTADAQYAMERKVNIGKELIWKAESARAVPIGVLDELKQDLSWIEKLAQTGGYGNVVAYAGNTYFWRYDIHSFESWGFCGYAFRQSTNTMVRLKPDGQMEDVFIAEAHGKFAVLQDSIVFRESSGRICAVDLNGRNKRTLTNGELCGVTEDGMNVICKIKSDVENRLAIVSMEGKVVASLGTDLWYLACYEGSIYCYRTVDNGYSIELLRYQTQNNRLISLYTTPVYDMWNAPMQARPRVAQISFGEEYVYISFGDLVGTGLMFDGAKIARVRYDGRGGKIIGGDDDAMEAHFVVKDDKSITMYRRSENQPRLFQHMNPLHISNGVISRLDAVTGELQTVLLPQEYRQLGFDYSQLSLEQTPAVQYAEIVNGRIYCMLHGSSNTVDPSHWREWHQRERTVLLEKDPATGQIRILLDF